MVQQAYTVSIGALAVHASPHYSNMLNPQFQIRMLEMNNNCASISLSRCGPVQLDVPYVALTPARPYTVVHMHLKLFGRCSIWAGRNGLYPI